MRLNAVGKRQTMTVGSLALRTSSRRFDGLDYAGNAKHQPIHHRSITGSTRPQKRPQKRRDRSRALISGDIEASECSDLCTLHMKQPLGLSRFYMKPPGILPRLSTGAPHRLQSCVSGIRTRTERLIRTVSRDQRREAVMTLVASVWTNCQKGNGSK